MQRQARAVLIRGGLIEKWGLSGDTSGSGWGLCCLFQIIHQSNNSDCNREEEAGGYWLGTGSRWDKIEWKWTLVWQQG